MKKFNFRLESVLKVRSLHKKMAERKLATTQAALHKTNEELEENQERYRQSFEFLSQQTENVAFWHDVTVQYQRVLFEKQNDLETKQKKLTGKLDLAKKNLSRKLKDEMVIEKLKEYQKQEHQMEAEGEAQKEMEEIDILKRGAKK